MYVFQCILCRMSNDINCKCSYESVRHCCNRNILSLIRVWRFRNRFFFEVGNVSALEMVPITFFLWVWMLRRAPQIIEPWKDFTLFCYITTALYLAVLSWERGFIHLRTKADLIGALCDRMRIVMNRINRKSVWTKLLFSMAWPHTDLYADRILRTGIPDLAGQSSETILIFWSMNALFLLRSYELINVILGAFVWIPRFGKKHHLYVRAI